MRNTEKKAKFHTCSERISPDSQRAVRSKNRDQCKRTMDDTGEEVPVSQSPSSDATENKVKINHTEDLDVTILTSCK